MNGLYDGKKSRTASESDSALLFLVPPRGLEPQHVTHCKASKLQNLEKSSGAESGALSAKTTKISPDPRLVIEAWPKLSDAVKAGILAMVKASIEEKSV